MDHILFWNEVALEANRQDFTVILAGQTKPMPEQGGPTLSSRALAIVHLAMYDAQAGVVNNSSMPRYLAAPPNPAANASAAAAVAHAAHRCLIALFPRQIPFFDAKLLEANVAAGAGIAAGRNFGIAVAAAILADRAADPVVVNGIGYVASTSPCGHRADPSDSGQGYHAPFYGANSKGFAISARHELDPPPAHGSPEYTRAVKQVRGKGVAPELMGTVPDSYPKRSSDETLIGVYWAYDGPRELGTPPRLYNQITREVAIQRGNDVNANARLFALVNAAMGDAGILAWDQKYVYELWRPVLGVREHDFSMGPAAASPDNNINNDCDPFWLPLGAPASNSTNPNTTPPFPAYPSGHATFGAAALHMIRLFYGIAIGNREEDRSIFNGPFVSEELNGVNRDNKGVIRTRHVRNFPRGLWQMIEENGFSRVYLGVHWFFDAFALDEDGKPDLTKNIGGVPLGLKIAEDIYAEGGGKAPKKSNVLPR